MSNKIKDINIKNHRYYFFDDIINIKNFDSKYNKIENILIYCIEYLTIKDSKYVKINSVNPWYILCSANLLFKKSFIAILNIKCVDYYYTIRKLARVRL